MNLPIIYGQREYKDKLGNSNVTIAGYGCAITSLAMLCEYCGIHVTPPQLNQWLTNNNGYANGNLVVWNAIDRFTGGKVKYQGIKTPTEYPCIAEVDLIPQNSQFDQHFVVALDKYVCADPWEKRVRPLSDFGGVKSFRIYSLPAVVNPTPQPTIGGSMDKVMADAFLDILSSQYNDHFDTNWNDDQKKAWIAQKKQRIIDSIKASQNPPTAGDPQLQAKYDQLSQQYAELSNKVVQFKNALSNL